MKPGTVVTLAAVGVALAAAPPLATYFDQVEREKDNAAVRQQLSVCQNRKQFYVQCTAVDSTHDLCERVKR